VNLVHQQQADPTYRALNPAALVPTLHIDGLTLTQSVPILEYLDETRPEAPLLPHAPAARAKVRALTLAIAADIQPIQNLRVIQKVDDKPKWAHHWIKVGFDALEESLKDSAGLYSYGDAVSIADCVLVPQVYNAERWGVDMVSYPTISRVNAELMNLSAFQESHPSQQPDAPKEPS
jgi:maleylacetoacetate isomerase